MKTIITRIKSTHRKALLLLMILLLAMAPLQPLFAQANSLDFTANDIQTYDPRATLACGPSGAAGDSQLVGGDAEQNEREAFTYFVTQLGLSPAQAAGIIGNLKQESNIMPRTVQSNGVGHGIAQWSKDGRWAALLAWAKNRDPWLLGTQLDFIKHEMTNVAPWKETLPALKGIVIGSTYSYPSKGTRIEVKTMDDAVVASTYAFEQHYEKAGKPNMDNRIKYARAAMAKYGGSVQGPGGAPTTTSQGCTTAGGIGTADGFTFPLKTTKSTILNNRGVTWCSDDQANCHHDYNAADIGAPTGTEVVAAKGGVVKHLRSGTDANVGILGEDNNFYYYTHMNGAIKVRDEQKVTAGQPLGNVGTAVDADDTAPHLHIDVQPPPATGRPGCAGAACKAYTFINIQPPLVKAFQALPN